jgi:hypothetical protein
MRCVVIGIEEAETLMDDMEDKIRVRAYEIWERVGRMGDPEDHWFKAEREVRAEMGEGQRSRDSPEATVDNAPPVDAVTAVEAIESDTRKSDTPE